MDSKKGGQVAKIEGKKKCFFCFIFSGNRNSVSIKKYDELWNVKTWKNILEGCFESNKVGNLVF